VGLLKNYLFKKTPYPFVCDYNSMSKSHDLKLLLIGMSDTGKTSLLFRYFNDSFGPVPETVGYYYNEVIINVIEGVFLSKKMMVDSSMIKVACWDLSGQERYMQMYPMYYKDISAILVVYSISSRDSVVRLKSIIRDLKVSPNLPKNVVLAMTGNKKDTRRVVEFAPMEEYATSNNILFMETSSKTGENVKELFEQIVRNFRAQTGVTNTQQPEKEKDPLPDATK